MSTYNLFLSASQADDAITNAYRLFDANGLTGESIKLYGGDIDHLGVLNSEQINITGTAGSESYISLLTGGIRVEGDSEIENIINGVNIYGSSYIQTLVSGLSVQGNSYLTGSFSNVGSFLNNGSVSINGTTIITGITNITGNTNINGSLTLNGNSTIRSNTAYLSGNSVTLIGLDTFQISGANGIDVIGNTEVQGNFNVVGNLTVSGVPVSGGGVTYIFESGSIFTGVSGGGGGTVQAVNLSITATDEGSPTGLSRGANAIDLQVSRNSTDQIAAGTYSAILAGSSNRAQATYSAIIGSFSSKTSGTHSVALGSYGGTSRSTAPHSIINGDYPVSYNPTEFVQSISNGLVNIHQRSSLVGKISIDQYTISPDTVSGLVYFDSASTFTGLYIPENHGLAFKAKLTASSNGGFYSTEINGYATTGSLSWASNNLGFGTGSFVPQVNDQDTLSFYYIANDTHPSIGTVAVDLEYLPHYTTTPTTATPTTTTTSTPTTTTSTTTTSTTPTTTTSTTLAP